MKRVGERDITGQALIGCTYSVLAFVFLGICVLPFVIINGWANGLKGLLILAGAAALIGLIAAFAIRDPPAPPAASPPTTHGSAHWATEQEAQPYTYRREEQP